MNDDQEDNYNKKGDDVLAGLRQLAERLDAQQFPGQAWTAPVRPVEKICNSRRVPLRWNAVISAVAVVAIMTLGVQFFVPAWQSFVSQTPESGRGQGTGGGENMEFDVFSGEAFVNFPSVDEYFYSGDLELMIVEDFESYSIIDMSTGSPLISYVRKDSFDVNDVVPDVLPVVEATDDQT